MGRRSFNYRDLHDQEFEELSFLLGHSEEPKLLRPGNPDLGLDGVVPGVGTNEPATWGLQAKHFARAPSWPKCRKSLDDAVANYAVKHVTFTFPMDLTGKQLKKFNEELAHRHAGVRVDYWGASELTARLIGSDAGERIARHVFGDQEFVRLSRMIRAQRDLDHPGQAFAALGAANSLFAGDPYFDYTVGSRPTSVPGVPPASGAVMRVELTDEHGVHHIDAYATTAALAADRLPRGLLRLAEEDAIRRFQEFLRVGGDLELENVDMDFEQLPKYLRQLVDGGPGILRLESERSLPARPMRFEITSDAGHASIRLDMQATAPPPGWDHELSGQAQGMTMQLLLRMRGGRGEMSLNWLWRSGDARSANDQLEALRFLEAASEAGDVHIIDAGTDALMSRGPSPEVTFDDEMKALKHVLESIVAVERWLDGPVHTPNQITARDAAALDRIVALIDGIAGTWTKATFTLEDDPGPNALVDGGLLQARNALQVELFGRRYELGEEVTYLEQAKVVRTSVVDGARRYELAPAAVGAKTLTRLERRSAAVEQPAFGR